jgi:hypothetical protein
VLSEQLFLLLRSRLALGKARPFRNVTMALQERLFMTSGCTLSGLDEPIHVEAIWNHAHLVGRAMYMEVSPTALGYLGLSVLGTPLATP